MPHIHKEDNRRASPWGVFRVFLKLGLTSFGGPAAHIGYFRAELVERRKWLDDRAYANLVALCQFLPGPASSQVGLALGLKRAGLRGAIAAFLAFTLPSASLMVAFAAGASLVGGPVGEGVLAGLKVVAVAIVAQAVLGMARSLTPDLRRATVALLAGVTAWLIPGALGQIVAIVFGATAGYFVCRANSAPGSAGLRFQLSHKLGITCLTLFAVMLVGLPILARTTQSETVALFDTFYRAGSIVFGGGHVVLPLLQSGLVDTGWVTSQDFLAGYGAAQAVPGPLFTFAAYLGAISTTGPGGILGAAIALLAIFLPGVLLLIGVLPFWDTLQQQNWLRKAMPGVNAAVVGILAAALYDPVIVTTITSVAPLILAMLCFLLLTATKAPPWAVVVIGAIGGAIIMALISPTN
jgi:chromate transporter